MTDNYPPGHSTRLSGEDATPPSWHANWGNDSYGPPPRIAVEPLSSATYVEDTYAHFIDAAARRVKGATNTGFRPDPSRLPPVANPDRVHRVLETLAAWYWAAREWIADRIADHEPEITGKGIRIRRAPEPSRPVVDESRIPAPTYAVPLPNRTPLDLPL